MPDLWLDVETRSVLQLDERGLDNYIHDPSSQLLMAAYAFDDRTIKLWEPHKSPIPAELEDALLSPWVTVMAWNAPFEHAVVNHLLKIPKPISEFRDAMIQARYLSLPGSLEDAGEILGLGEGEAKMKEGKRLIRLFCEPESMGGEQTLLGVSEPTFRDWRTDPADWKLFGDYCKQDVSAERIIYRKLRKFPLPESEWETWLLSEKINWQAGWPVDLEIARNAHQIVLHEIAPLVEELKELTGIPNPNSRDQILKWLQTQGYGFSSLGKDFAKRALSGECPLTDAARRVLEIRSQTAKSSIKKYTAIADRTSEDGRLRGEYQFMGAARTHRWSAIGVNVGNLPRPEKKVEKNLDQALDLVRKMDFEGITRHFGKPLDFVSSVLRSSFQAPKGYKFVVCDLASIENRCLGWLAHCDPILNVFKTMFTYEGADVLVGKEWVRGGDQFPMDPYLEFATRMYQKSYAELWQEWKIKQDSSKRTLAKPGSLGAGYSLGVGEEKIIDGNKVRTGLRGYAEAMGVSMTPEEAAHAIKVFRESYKEVTWYWKDMTRAAMHAIRNPGPVIPIGVPLSDRDRGYFESIGRPTDWEPILFFQCHGTKVLELKLPSGRSLHYLNPRITESEGTITNPKTGETETFTRKSVCYEGREQGTRHWRSTPTHGGKLCENSCQTVSRDILVHGMKLADQMGFEIVGHLYDEIVTIVPVNSSLGVKDLEHCMTQVPSWAAGLPLAAEGYESDYYKKG